MAELVETPLKQTIPFDPRFPNQNQTRNCWQNYVDFHRCQKLKVDFTFIPRNCSLKMYEHYVLRSRGKSRMIKKIHT